MSHLGIFSIGETVYFDANTVDKNGSALAPTSGPDYQVFKEADDTVQASGSMTKRGDATSVALYRGTFATTTFSAGQYFIHLYATVDSETPEAVINFQLVSADQSVDDTFTEIQVISDNVSNLGLIQGTGSVSVDHDFGGTDNLRTMAGGTPIARVSIRAFSASDYNTGKRANAYIVGQGITKTDGRWLNPIRLDPGSYVLEFAKTGAYRTTTATITVS